LEILLGGLASGNACSDLILLCNQTGISAGSADEGAFEHPIITANITIQAFFMQHTPEALSLTALKQTGCIPN
jgi:hypothetical protein